MRPLQNDDMYLLSEIADKMDLEFPKMPKLPDKATKAEKEAMQWEYGRLIFASVMRKIYKAKNEFNQLISNVMEKPIDEVSSMPIKETMQCFVNILKEDGVLDFFK